MNQIYIDSPTDVLSPAAGHYLKRAPKDYDVLRPHGTQDWLIIYTKRGEGSCRGINSTIQLLPGDLLLIEPGRPHDYSRPPSSVTWDLLWVHFLSRPDWRLIIESLPEIIPGHRVLKIPLAVRPLLVNIFTGIIRNAAAHTPYHELFAMHQIERLFLAIYKCSAKKSIWVLDSRILRVIQYIQNHLNTPLHLEDIAAKSGMSKFRLAHLFRAQVGVSAHRFIMTQRMRKACDLLETTTLTIGEIAYQTGFSNPAHFSYQFKCRVRYSPGAYRLRKKGQARFH